MIGESTNGLEGSRTVDFEAVFDAVDEGVVVYDRGSGRILDANERVCELLDCDRERVVDASVEEFGMVADADRSGMGDHDDEDRRVVRSERHTGELNGVPVAVGLRPAGDGTVVATVSERDPRRESVTDRRSEERNRRLRTVNRVLRHDVRNDMAVVCGWAETLAGRLDGESAEIAAGIGESSEHVVGITRTARDLMDTLDADDGPERSAVDLRTVLADELDARETTYPEATFVVGDVPDVEVRANALLGSVFRNLLDNAVQHSDRPEPRVEVEVTVSAETVVVRVADDGPGIPVGKADAIFGRTDAGLDHHAAGLGLHLVDALVTEYGGEARARNRDQRGAVFEVELRRA